MSKMEEKTKDLRNTFDDACTLAEIMISLKLSLLMNKEREKLNRGEDFIP
jgi:hypothetical protein